jgi:L-ribulose-5-phosphate 4-epimerase
MLEKLKAEVCKANLDLVRKGLVIETWGNASAIDRDRGLVVIKPSGVPYDGMMPKHMVVVALDDGKVVEGDLKPSSDTPTHLVLYRSFAEIGGVVHTHSLHATSWAQACKPLLAYGTTQADYWYGEVPCTRLLKIAEIEVGLRRQYTGYVIVEAFKKAKFDPLQHPAVLVASHGPFTWGKDVADAVHNAGVLEFIARLNSETLRINPKSKPMQSVLLDKHFLRKHGATAYYGQTRKH